MTYQKDFQKFKEFITIYDNSIKTNDFQQLNKLIPLINDFEEKFLTSYHKRKKEGTFYTNKQITDFIVSETLIHLINKKFNNYDLIPNKINKIDEIYKLNTEFKEKISKLLSSVKICDPACGSGEFLLSSAEITFNIIRKLNSNISIGNIKKLILNNLYGYDINEYAIKLCLLKLLKWYHDKSESNGKKIVSLLKSNIVLTNSLINSNLPKFDIIIGNPPYGNILSQDDKEILKKENIFYKDIYCAFLLKALEWSKEVIGFLVPKSFLLRQSYINFRHKFLSKANILKIYDIGSKMFKTATNEVQIVLYENNKTYKKKDLDVYDYPKTKIITYPNQFVDSLRICFNLNCPLILKSKKLYVYTFANKCSFCGSDTVEMNRIRIKPNEEIYNLIEKIEKIGDLNYLNPVDFPKMIRGEEEKGLKLVKSNLRKDTNGSCLFISARNDFTYYNFRKIKSFNIEQINSKILKGINYEYYKQPKLLIKHNNIIPEAVYTEEYVCFTSSIYSLLHNQSDELKFICAILNSSLIQFYCIYGINNQKDTTINLNQYMIRHLPIIAVNNEIKKLIADKVERVNNLLITNELITNESVHVLLKDIDDIIFNQYLLTEKEKNLIISELRMQIKHFQILYHK
ncbi:MAG: Eco57I restriction-modification methylase domain-containing protein [Promethearchaeota archaeon]